MYRDTVNVESEINGHASNNQSHQHSNKRFKEKFGCHTMKTFNKFAIKEVISHVLTYSLEQSPS